MEAVVLCGIQGSGKTTFYLQRFFETHVRISLDLLRTRNREARFVAVCLDTGQAFVVDKVNATADDRRRYVEPARDRGFRVVAYVLETPVRLAIARNESRTGRARIPIPGILGAAKRLQPPTLEEGFDGVCRVTPDGDGGFVVEPVA
jgi:predicted kinase